MGLTESGDYLSEHEHDQLEPFLVSDVQVARQFWFHLLVLPGDDKPLYHRRLDSALQTLIERGYSTAVVCSAGRHYRLTHLG